MLLGFPFECTWTESQYVQLFAYKYIMHVLWLISRTCSFFLIEKSIICFFKTWGNFSRRKAERIPWKVHRKWPANCFYYSARFSFICQQHLKACNHIHYLPLSYTDKTIENHLLKQWKMQSKKSDVHTTKVWA